MVKELFRGELKRPTVTVIVSALCATALGILSHFLYELCGNNMIVGLFCPINESIWEHLKLLFFPFLLTAVIEYFIYGKESPAFFFSKLIGVLSGLIMIVTEYYTILGIFGRVPMPVTIGIFIGAVISAYITSYFIILHPKRFFGFATETVSIILFVVIAILFFAFTTEPPPIPFFLDPETGKYGIG